MINGGYDLHVYCDTPTCKLRHAVRGEAPGQYFGRNFREAWADARKDGWHRHRNPHGGWLHFCGACKRLFTGNS